MYKAHKHKYPIRHLKKVKIYINTLPLILLVLSSHSTFSQNNRAKPAIATKAVGTAIFPALRTST